MEGHASISPEVIARYAGDAALEVEGVRRLVEGHLPRHRGVRIASADDGAVSRVAPVSPLTRGGIQPISSTSTSTRSGWRSAIRAR